MGYRPGMAKRTASRAARTGRAARTAGDQGNGSQPNPRQPCPCGSGKRYKACHGAPGGATDVVVTRPFDGLAAECELIALREFVPSATAPLPLAAGTGDGRQLTLATVLPMAAAALVREDGTGLVGMQVQTKSADVSRDLAAAVRWALDAEPGAVLPAVGRPGAQDTTRLQDLLDTGAELQVTLHKDFSWWVPDGEEPSGDIALSLERANSAIQATERVDAPGVSAAYWSDGTDIKAYLRWVRPEPEEQLLSALARLNARGELDLGDGSRYAGSFRAHGLLVPVWDLDQERHAREWAEPAAAFAGRLTGALAGLDAQPLTDAERRTLQGLRGRQLTIR